MLKSIWIDLVLELAVVLGQAPTPLTLCMRRIPRVPFALPLPKRSCVLDANGNAALPEGSRCTVATYTYWVIYAHPHLRQGRARVLVASFQASRLTVITLLGGPLHRAEPGTFSWLPFKAPALSLLNETGSGSEPKRGLIWCELP